MWVKLQKLACSLGLHRWKTETRGIQLKGSVYPLRFRTCVHCGLCEKELFDEYNEVVGWVRQTPVHLDNPEYEADQ